jgi:tail sheath protein
VLAPRRLPGITVDVAPPPAVEALPRMDVAVFVGFASTGPLHRPVVLESAGEFAAVFGADLPLAWDETRGERLYAYLGPTVRAFFSNGGRRCWVIRVADVESALSNVFEVPGVLEVDGGAVRPASAKARCEGSWSDKLRLASALSGRSFSIEALAVSASPPNGPLAFRTHALLTVGDLIELRDLESAVAYAVVERLTLPSTPSGAQEVLATVCAAFERLKPDSIPITVAPDFDSGTWTRRVGEDDVVIIERLPDSVPAPGALTFEEGRWTSWVEAGSTVWMRVDKIVRAATATVASGAAWRQLPATLPFDPGTVRAGRALSLDLRVTGDELARLPSLGLTPQHRDAWWNQLSDAEFFAAPDDDGPGQDALSRADQPRASAAPRFPLSPADSPRPLALRAKKKNESIPTWIPLGVDPLFGADLGPIPQPATALERDGLKEFNAALFLDPELADTPIDTVLEYANSIRYVRQTTRSLRGVHAALSIGGGGAFTEASLIAVPDAVHVGWARRDGDRYIAPRQPEPEVPPQWRTHRGACLSRDEAQLTEPDFGVFLDCTTRKLNKPDLTGQGAPVPPGSYSLSWTDSEPGATYSLIESTQPDLSFPREVFRAAGTEDTVLNTREGVYYYQVFAWRGDDRSDGSNVVAVRVRADDYSELPPDNGSSLEPPWLTVHRALLRLAAASGELFAALAMPRHFRTGDALRYSQSLRDAMASEGRALSYGALYFPWMQSEVHAPPDSGSQDAVRAALREPRVIPPDGPATGVLAARASSRGAWIAAANEPLDDIVALSPDVESADWQALQDAQVNLVRNDPRGFLCLSADTLSDDPDVRPINVRRLLTLLRRLALRRGASYVFEPNGPQLRRAVERGFETLLRDLFRRGAFAGATEALSYRVVADDTINTPRDADAGRFVVELHVAPSIPMRFIAVRLAQDGPRLSVTEEL